MKIDQTPAYCKPHNYILVFPSGNTVFQTSVSDLSQYVITASGQDLIRVKVSRTGEYALKWNTSLPLKKLRPNIENFCSDASYKLQKEIVYSGTAFHEKQGRVTALPLEKYLQAPPDSDVDQPLIPYGTLLIHAEKFSIQVFNFIYAPHNLAQATMGIMTSSDLVEETVPLVIATSDLDLDESHYDDLQSVLRKTLDELVLNKKIRYLRR